jgi:hypothetical protein
MVGQVGCVPFSSSGYVNTEYLIFGAVKAFVLSSNSDDDSLQDMYQMSISEEVTYDRVEISVKMKKLDQILQYPDRVYHNQYFYREAEDGRRHLIVPSREAMHVFYNTGKNQLTYLGSDLSRRYKTLIDGE